MQLKTLDINAESLPANGKTYYIEPHISFERYYIYMMVQHELAFGVSYAQMYQAWGGVIDSANKQRFSDIVITANNIVNGMMKLEKKEPQALTMCALFINTADEDRTTITEEQIRTKINDWAKEGYSIVPFFKLAASFVNGLAEDWNDLLQAAKDQPISPV